jgi:tetratricopeptide (TPR) repeat protein
MGKPRIYLALLFLVATVPTAGLIPALADPSCSTLDASAAFSSSLSLPPATSAPFVEIRTDIAQGHFERAASLLDRTPRGAEQSLWRGMLLLHTGKTFASIRSLEEASHFQDNSMVEILLGVDYLLLNQRKLTEQSIQRALSFEPGNKLALYLRGRFNFVGHNFSQAAKDFGSVLETEHDDYRSLFYLGYSEWRMGESAEAARYLGRSLDIIQCLKINFALAPETLAEIELQNGDLAHALAHADLAFSMASQIKDQEDNLERASNVLLLRGKIHSALGEQAEAIHDWRQALALDPGLADCWYLLAHVYRQRGETALADEALNQFKALHEEL